MRCKLNVGFKSMKRADFLARAERINRALRGNAHFPEPWPHTVPSREELDIAIANYRIAERAASVGDSRKAATRDLMRLILILQLSQLALYLEAACGGAPSLLATTGYGLDRSAPGEEICGRLPRLALIQPFAARSAA